MLAPKRRIHFIGIGGIGMSAIARLLRIEGHDVSGSDAKNSRIIDEMKKEGIKCFIGHDAENIKDCGMVVYSSAIDKNNSELTAARKSGIKIIHRAGMLSKLFSAKRGIAVTGSHGKTTTAALISLIFKSAGMEPQAAVGGEMLNFGSNILYGKGDYFIAEADESDGSFLKLRPDCAVLLNIDKEHMDYFKDMGNALKVYRKFADNVRARGMVCYNSDDACLRKALNGCRRRLLTFGVGGAPDVTAFEIKSRGLAVSFRCAIKGRNLPGVITFHKPGRHNVTNALGAIAAASCWAGVGFDAIRDGIGCYAGTKRRFEIKNTSGNVMVVEDYAHHPTEICAVLEACRPLRKNIIAVFQPHRYTRTKDLFADFLNCFRPVGRLILTDIYAASEKPIEGISAEQLCLKMKRSGHKNVEYLKKNAIAGRIKDIAKQGDIVLILGAGDINEVAAELEKAFPAPDIRKERRYCVSAV